MDLGFIPLRYSLSHDWYDPGRVSAINNNTLKYKSLDPKLRSEKQHKWNEPLLWPLFGLLSLLAVWALWVLQYIAVMIIVHELKGLSNVCLYHQTNVVCHPDINRCELDYFWSFFMVNSPDSMARQSLGTKHTTQVQIERWKTQHGYDKPKFLMIKHRVWLSLLILYSFKNRCVCLLSFGASIQGRDIGRDISQRMWPSLALAVPTLLLGLFVNITFALLVALFRGSVFDRYSMVFCITIMSISGLFYVIFGQVLLGLYYVYFGVGLSFWLGYDPLHYFTGLIGVVSGMGMGTRWYRTLFRRNK